MKKTLFVLFFLYAGSSLAQNGFFLQPLAGVGFTNAKENRPMWGYKWSPPTGYYTYNFLAAIGYQYDHWGVVSGFSSLRTGYMGSFYEPGSHWGQQPIRGKEIIIDYSCAIHLVAGYQINAGKHLFFTPGIGAAIAYNVSERQTFNYSNGASSNEQSKTLSGAELRKQNNTFSPWGIVQLQFGYKINSRLSVTAMPQAQYMLTSILKDDKTYQNNYVYNFNAGIVWHFTRNNNVK